MDIQKLLKANYWSRAEIAKWVKAGFVSLPVYRQDLTAVQTNIEAIEDDVSILQGAVSILQDDVVTAELGVGDLEVAVAALGQTVTWTPRVAVAGSSTGITYTARSGWYTLVGSRFTYDYVILLSNKGAGSGAVTIEDFPVAFVNGANRCDIHWGAFTTSYVKVAGILTGTSMAVRGLTAAGVSSNAGAVNAADITNTSLIVGQGSYLTA